MITSNDFNTYKLVIIDKYEIKNNDLDNLKNNLEELIFAINVSDKEINELVYKNNLMYSKNTNISYEEYLKRKINYELVDSLLKRRKFDGK